MRKKGKIKTIIDAFTKESNIDKDILIKRRKICDGCDYNSNNISNSSLSTLNKARKRITKSPFCTACGCQIFEKTSSETEECGLVYIDKSPKWNRLKLETKSKSDLNIFNKSSDKVNIDLDSKGVYVLDIGIVKHDFNKVLIKLLINNDNDLTVLSITPSCGSCTSVRYEAINSNNIELNIELKLNKLPYGKINKNVYIVYTLNNETNTCQLRLSGNIKNQ